LRWDGKHTEGESLLTALTAGKFKIASESRIRKTRVSTGS
jgi:hypothetical protein